jgi:hypothetical protein
MPTARTFRYNNRAKLGMSDTARAAADVRGAEGKRLTYRGLGSPENPEAVSPIV